MTSAPRSGALVVVSVTTPEIAPSSAARAIAGASVAAIVSDANARVRTPSLIAAHDRPYVDPSLVWGRLGATRSRVEAPRTRPEPVTSFGRARTKALALRSRATSRDDGRHQRHVEHLGWHACVQVAQAVGRREPVDAAGRVALRAAGVVMASAIEPADRERLALHQATGPCVGRMRGDESAVRLASAGANELTGQLGLARDQCSESARCERIEHEQEQVEQPSQAIRLPGVGGLGSRQDCTETN